MGEKGSVSEPGPVLRPHGLEGASEAGRGSGGLDGGGELGVWHNDNASSGTKGSAGGIQTY